MKVLKITNVTTGFGMFCMATDVRFIYDYGTFYILGTQNADAFRSFCKKHCFSCWETMNITPHEYKDYEF